MIFQQETGLIFTDPITDPETGEELFPGELLTLEEADEVGLVMATDDGDCVPVWGPLYRV
jgi:hypothetical protein